LFFFLAAQRDSLLMRSEQLRSDMFCRTHDAVSVGSCERLRLTRLPCVKKR
jgi:hypothetical protein